MAGTKNRATPVEVTPLCQNQLLLSIADREVQLDLWFEGLGLGRTKTTRLRVWDNDKGRTAVAGKDAPVGWSAGYPINGWNKDACVVLVHEDDGPDDLQTKAERWMEIGLEPTLQVWSGNKSIHNYWVMDQPVSPDQWQKLQKRLALTLGGDCSLSDLGQIMRVPGYTHPRTNKMTVVLDKPSRKRYPADLISGVLLALPEKTGRPVTGGPIDFATRCALAFLGQAWGPYTQGQGTYPDRLRIAEFLSDRADGLETWTVCFGDEGLGRRDADSLFNSLSGVSEDPCNAGSVIYMAKALGWQHPVTSAKSLKEIKDLELTVFASAKDLETAAGNLEGKESKNLLELRKLQTEARIFKAPEDSVLSICRVSDKGTLKLPVDSEVAKLLAKRWKDLYRKDKKSRVLYRWSGQCWLPTNLEEIQKSVAETLDDLEATINYKTTIANYLFACCFSELKPPKKGCLGFQNGFLNGEFKPHHPDNLNRSVLAFDYDPKARCPGIEGWLNWCKDDPKALIAVLRSALLGRPGNTQFFAEITGVSRSGKSTFGNLCRALAGKDFVHETDPVRLEKGRFELSALVDKRLIVLNDIARYGGEVSVLKSLTSGESLTAESKGLNERLSFAFDGLVLVTGEHTLKTSDYQSGIDRRRFQIHFEKRYEGPSRDLLTVGYEISGEWASELPGLVNLLLGVSDAEAIDILSNPAEVNSAEWKEEQLSEQNPIAGFLLDKYQEAPGSQEVIPTGNALSPTGLYHDYVIYCAELAILPVSLTRFGRDIKDVMTVVLKWKVEKVRTNKVKGGWKGLKRQD